MVSIPLSSVVDCWMDSSPSLGQNKDYKIDICFFFDKHVVLQSKSNDWFTWNQYNVSEWGDIYLSGLFNECVHRVHYHSLIEIHLVIAMI